MTTYYEPGRYACRVIAQGFGESKKKKTPYFFLAVKPIGLRDPADPDGRLLGCADYPREVQLYISDAAAQYTIERLRLLGYRGDSFRDLEPGGSFSLVDSEIELECKHETNDGETYDRFGFPFESEPAENVEGVAKKLDGLFGKELRKTAPKKGTNSTPEPEPEPVGAGDDIPF